MDHVHDFFTQLRILRWLKTAEGIQLDGIGNIVDLSRTQALIWSNLAGQNVPMDDELYRLYLMFKIFLNTSEGTYADIVRALKMFWPRTPIYYSERLENPATMFWTLENVNPFAPDAHVLAIAAKVKAAGVALRFVFTEDMAPQTNYHAAAMLHTISMRLSDDREIETTAANYHAGAANWRLKEAYSDE